MGKIPEYGRRAPLRNVPDTSGRQEAEALRATGEVFGTLGGIAQQSADFEMKKQRLHDESYLNKSSIKLREEATKAREDWQLDFQEDPLGKTEVLKSRLGEIKQNFLDQAPTGAARHRMGIATDQYFLGVSQTAKDWEAKQVVNLGIKDADEGMKRLQTEVYRSPTPANLDLLQKEANQLMSPLQGNLDPALIDEMKNSFGHASTISMFEGLIDKNRLGSAKQLLNSKEFDEDLGVKGIRRIKSEIDRKQRFNKRKTADLYNMKLTKPWTYVKKVGENIPQIDVNNLSPEALFARSRFNSDMAKKHGVDLGFFSPQEEGFVIKKLEKGNPRETQQMMSSINTLPDKEFNGFAFQLMNKVPAYGAVMGVTRGGSPTAEQDSNLILKGMRLIGDTKAGGEGVKAPSSSKVNEAFDSYLKTSISDPLVREGIRDASFYHYSQRMFEKGEIPVDLDEKEFKKSVDAISGHPLELGGRTVLPFRDDTGAFVDEDTFEDTFDRLDDEIIEKTHNDVPRTFNGEPVNMEKSGGRINLQNVREGEYYLFIDDRITMDKNNKFFILDMRKIHKVPPKGLKDFETNKNPFVLGTSKL